MNPVGSNDEQAIESIARRHGFSVDATRAMFDAVIGGNGSMAQFSHPEFGGSGQWMRGGMTMLGDMFNHRLKAAVDALCVDLASLAASRAEPRGEAVGGRYQSQHQGSGQHPLSTDADGASSRAEASLASSPNAGFASSSGRWWPGDLGTPNVSGSQNGMRYAWFAGSRRLAIESGGEVTVYDTGEHRIGGVSQQQSAGSRLSFTSQLGPVDIGRLTVVHPQNAADTSDASARPTSADLPPASTGREPQDVPRLIERLAELHAGGILTDAEFNGKKAELMRRI